MVYLIYHEKQESALCGVHCLNNLLQGSYFNASDLAEIAQDIDASEKSLMLEAGHSSEDFLRFMAEDSGNVADTGFFSVQVLRTALERVFSLNLVPIQSEAGRSAIENPTAEKGFICNLEEHWFAIREIDGTWYNINSTADEPQFLSQFYLSAFLDTLIKSGYSIFVVRGIFPQIVEEWGQPNWVPVPNSNSRNSVSNSRSNEEDDEELQRAINASLQNQPIDITSNDDDDELARAIAASLETPSATSSNTGNIPTTEIIDIDMIDSEDEELQASILLSQQGISQERKNNMEFLDNILKLQEPNFSADNLIKLLIEVPHKGKVECVVQPSTTLQSIMLLVTHKLNINDNNNTYHFQLNYPRKQFDNLNATIEQVEWEANQKVMMISKN